MSWDAASGNSFINILPGMSVRAASGFPLAYRPPGMSVPAGFRLAYEGQEIPIQSSCTYLGVQLHCTDDMLV